MGGRRSLWRDSIALRGIRAWVASGAAALPPASSGRTAHGASVGDRLLAGARGQWVRDAFAPRRWVVAHLALGSIPGGAMEPDRFDALTRALDVGSRRRVLGAAVGMTLGALGPVRDPAEIAARRRRRNRKRKKQPTCGFGEYCGDTCSEGPCSRCCGGHCGFRAVNPFLVCCVAKGQPCPGNCRKNEHCPGCCGSGICVSNGTCF